MFTNFGNLTYLTVGRGSYRTHRYTVTAYSCLSVPSIVKLLEYRARKEANPSTFAMFESRFYPFIKDMLWLL